MAGPLCCVAEAQIYAIRANMYYVYVLESLKNGKRYIGFTTRDPSQRLKEHNVSNVHHWAGRNKPFKLVYQEIFTEEELARRRENFFKTGNGRRFLDKKAVL